MRHRRVWVLGIGSIGLIAMAAWLAQWGDYAKRELNETVRAMGTRLGGDLQIGSTEFGFGTATLREVRLTGPMQGSIKSLRAVLNLNPFRGQMGALQELRLANIKLTIPLDTLLKSSQSAEKALSLKSSLLPSFVSIQNAEVRFTDAEGTERLRLSGIVGKLDSAREVSADTASIWLDGVQRFGKVQLQLVPARAGGYRFILADSAQATTKAWEFSGEIPATKDEILLLGKMQTTSDFKWAPEEGLKTALRLHLRYLRPTKELSFAVQLGTANLALQHPVLLPKALGPLPMRLKFSGFYGLESGELAVQRGVLSLRQDLRNGRKLEPLNFYFDLSQRDLRQPEAGWPWQLSLRLPATACQDLIAQAPTGLLPLLENEQFTGTAAINVDMSIPPLALHEFTYELQRGVFSCQLATSAFAHKRAREVMLQTEGRDYVPLAKIAPSFIKAVVAFEDSGFWRHGGFDIQILENALRRNLKEKRILFGGSTITMQTAKNLWLSPERTLSRKLEEILLTGHLEKALGKDKILELYANIIEYGPRIFGIKQAAAHYFNKTPADLNLLESSFLASVLPSPRRRYGDFCRGRLSPHVRQSLNRSLEHMVALGIIQAETYQTTLKSELRFAPRHPGWDAECAGPLAQGVGAALE